MNPATGAVEAVPRHTEMPDLLARKICVVSVFLSSGAVVAALPKTGWQGTPGRAGFLLFQLGRAPGAPEPGSLGLAKRAGLANDREGGASQGIRHGYGEH